MPHWKISIRILCIICLFVPGIFAEDAGKLAGRKICREAPGPEDTLQFELVLRKDGFLKGTGSLSGAQGIVYFRKGSWLVKNGRVFAEIELTGKMSSGQKMEKARRAIKFDFPVSEFSAAKGCYEPRISQ